MLLLTLHVSDVKGILMNRLVTLCAAMLPCLIFTGCSGSDSGVLAPPPVSAAATEKMTAAEMQMMETMSPGGIADPGNGS